MEYELPPKLDPHIPPPTTIVKYHVFPGTHYDFYEKNYRESGKMARA
jgi:hypothetical protein